MQNRLELQAVALFNFLLQKRECDRRIGDLSLADLVEMVRFLNEGAAHGNR